jgi:DNA (cytosine-5)-methyltransferase 1
VLELCAGYGGMSLALRLAGLDTRTVCFVERDSYAAATLVARMADQTLDQAPIWSDLDTFNGTAWRGRVDLITAGLPCQPFSAAGQRAGVDDERHLWPMACRIITDVRPRYVLLENVPDVVRAGWLTHVLADLAALGFDAEWGCLSAAAVGAPHRRQRFWLLAWHVADTNRDGRMGVG